MRSLTIRCSRLLVVLLCLTQWWNPIVTLSLSAPTKKTKNGNSSDKQNLPTLAELQKCITIEDMLQTIALRLPCGTTLQKNKNHEVLMLSSTLLVRLSKHVVAMDNQQQFAPFEPSDNHAANQRLSWEALENVVKALVSNGSWRSSPATLEAAVEATKAVAILARLLPDDTDDLWRPLMRQWQEISTTVAGDLLPHQLSGLKWAVECFQLVGMQNSYGLPAEIQNAYDALDLPFCIRPGTMRSIPDLTVPNLLKQVDFQVDTIRTTSNKLVPERRETAWEGDDTVAPFMYSGKSMPRRPWSPLVLQVRDILQEQTGVYYDGCLLNHYPDGGSGMRYHVDPDQGTLWDYSTAVVSVGATRKMAFREMSEPSHMDNDHHSSSFHGKPHVFTLMQGDCTEMFGNCQQRFQHTVRTAEMPNEQAARASLVFKKTLGS